MTAGQKKKEGGKDKSIGYLSSLMQRKKWLTREKNYTIMKNKANIRSRTEKGIFLEGYQKNRKGTLQNKEIGIYKGDKRWHRW